MAWLQLDGMAVPPPPFVPHRPDYVINVHAHTAKKRSLSPCILRIYGGIINSLFKLWVQAPAFPYLLAKKKFIRGLELFVTHSPVRPFSQRVSIYVYKGSAALPRLLSLRRSRSSKVGFVLSTKSLHPFHHSLSVSIVSQSAILNMPTFADVYNNAPAPTVHSTRYPTKSSHPTSTSHIPADAKPIDFRRMSSSKAGMGRTRGSERSSKPEEAPVGPEFAERTRIGSTSAGSDGAASPPTAESPSSPRKVFGAFDKRRASSGSPRDSTSEDPIVSETAVSPTAEKQVSPPGEESRTERRGSITNFFKKVF